MAEEGPCYLVRDRDSVYGEVFTRRLRAMGIRDRPTVPRSPWQNGYCKRPIGSICLDHILVFGERHLRRPLRAYADYYNRTRTHLSLEKDPPASRAIESCGRILALPLLGGLHHRADCTTDMSGFSLRQGQRSNDPSDMDQTVTFGWVYNQVAYCHFVDKSK